MNALPKYVVSRTLERTDRVNSHLLSGDVASAVAVADLKARPGRDLALFAGARAATSILGAGLVDELRLIVNPLLQCAGTRLFDSGYDARRLALTGVQRFASGALVLTYVPDGVRRR